MKTLITLLLVLSIHILATSAHRSMPNLIRLPTADDGAAAVAAIDTPMLDLDGDVLRNHKEYYMLPFTLPGIDGGAGGGVKLARLDPADECPADAIQTPDSYDTGTPVVFIADAFDSGNMTVLDPSVYQAVSFHYVSTCGYSLSWKIKYDDRSKKHFVKVGEAEGDQSYVFKVKRFRPNVNAYKIVYCPHEDEDICYNVGRFYDKESKNIRLALSNDPFVAVFKKFKA